MRQTILDDITKTGRKKEARRRKDVAMIHHHHHHCKEGKMKEGTDNGAVVGAV